MKRATANANESVCAATSPKRTKSDRSLPACLIKTEELFQDNFGEAFSIEKKELVLTEWNNEMGRGKIKAWLVSLGPYFAALLDKIKRNSEASLYTLRPGSCYGTQHMLDRRSITTARHRTN